MTTEISDAAGSAPGVALRQGSLWAAIDRSQLVIEFALDGCITWANDRFLAAMGYRLDDILGQHHRMFCDPAFARSADYAAFWTKLGRGEFDAGEYRRIGRDGRILWLRASYNPIEDADGRTHKILKVASDVTAETLAAAEARARLTAIGLSQSVIEFDMTGRVLEANDNFLRLFGYRRDEVLGAHHRIFCDTDYVRSPEYRAF